LSRSKVELSSLDGGGGGQMEARRSFRLMSRYHDQKLGMSSLNGGGGGHRWRLGGRFVLRHVVTIKVKHVLAGWRRWRTDGGFDREDTIGIDTICVQACAFSR
jgi:hypothetical protein